MKPRRLFRPNAKSPEERRKESALREKLQRERPSLDALIRAGEVDPDAVMTMGMYFDVQRALQALKKERQQRGLTVSDVALQSGLDRAAISRLENGKQDNPTVATLMRYAAAIGKRFLWSYDDVTRKTASANPRRRSARSSA
jgi:DNA-binding XRE family transcriptional regulator